MEVENDITLSLSLQSIYECDALALLKHTSPPPSLHFLPPSLVYQHFITSYKNSSVLCLVLECWMFYLWGGGSKGQREGAGRRPHLISRRLHYAPQGAQDSIQPFHQEVSERACALDDYTVISVAQDEALERAQVRGSRGASSKNALRSHRLG